MSHTEIEADPLSLRQNHVLLVCKQLIKTDEKRFHQVYRV